MFWERFVNECNKAGKKPNPVASELGLSSGSVTSWKNGTVPNTSTLRKIADYFSVTTDYLLGNDVIKEKVNAILEENTALFKETLSGQEKTLINLFRGTSEEGKLKIIQSIMNICDQAEKNIAKSNTESVG